MIIDIREIPVIWINLDSAKQNAEIMEEKFKKYGFKETYRKSGLIIPPPEGTDKSIAHFKGCGQSHIDILDDTRYKTPLLVLEDDIDFIDNFNPIFDIPDDSDGVYLGISHGNRNYQTSKKNQDYLRISGILAAHAILYVSDTFRKAMSDIGKHCLYKLNLPWDIGTSNIQHKFKVYTPNKPVIYQSNDRENANKWQNLTDKPLTNTFTVFPP